MAWMLFTLHRDGDSIRLFPPAFPDRFAIFDPHDDKSFFPAEHEASDWVTIFSFRS